jgi:hypothetical protein
MVKRILKFQLIFKSRFLKLTLRALGLCSACFLIEACYGSPQDELPPKNITLKGNVQSSDSLKPILGIKLKVTNSDNSGTFYSVTDSLGNFAFSATYNDNGNFLMQFIDEDSVANGKFLNKDSNIVISDPNSTENTTNVKLVRVP